MAAETSRTDIRDKAVISHGDVIGLNFIRDAKRYYFRRYHLNGLRSHIMEMIDVDDLDRETRGRLVDGIRQFPRARPIKMLRIFRRRFRDAAEARGEIERFNVVREYLTEAHLAVSDEFIVDYDTGGQTDIMLCGVQEYVDGMPLDPWTFMGRAYPAYLAGQIVGRRGHASCGSVDALAALLCRNLCDFVDRAKALILDGAHVPDLAGVRNILITHAAQVKLVDINNISPVASNGCVHTDDLGYPVCDKSVEALYLIEEKILGRTPPLSDPVYRDYRNAARRQAVDRLDRAFRAHLHTRKARNG